MTVQEMLDELDDHGFSDLTVARKLGVINDTYYDVLSREPWPFLEKSLSNSTTTNVAAITMPTDWSKTLGIVLTDGSNNSWNLKYFKLGTFQFHYPDATVTTITRGRPQVFTYFNSAISLYPVPDNVYTVLHRYIKQPTKLVQADIESALFLPPRHHRIVVLGALQKLYTMEDDFDIARIVEEQLERKYAMMRADLWQVQYDSDYIDDVWEDNVDASGLH